jgi:hypothetical protein
MKLFGGQWGYLCRYFLYKQKQKFGISGKAECLVSRQQSTTTTTTLGVQTTIHSNNNNNRRKDGTKRPKED